MPRTILAIVAVLSLLMSALVLASPVSATPEPDKHCVDHETTPKKEGAAVAPSTVGTITVGGVDVGYTISADGKTVTFTQSVNFCVKAAGDNSGPQSGTTFTVNWLNNGDQIPAISYFVVYTVNQAPETGSITIRKNSEPDHGQNFPFTTTGSGLSNFTLDDGGDDALQNTITFDNLAAGPYAVTEGTTAGWTLTSVSCTTGGSGSVATRTATIALVAGADVTCVFVNTKDAPPQEPELGSITIRKDTQPDHGQNFDFTATGEGLTNFTLDDGGDDVLQNTVTFGDLGAGTYSVTEVANSHWPLTSLSCTAGGVGDLSTRTATITLAAGADVTCTFTNTKVGSITIIKNAVPDSAQDFAFTTTGAGLSGFSLDDDADATLANQQMFAEVGIGTYTVTEAVTAGWTLSNVMCSAGGAGDTATRTATITITAGLDVTCTFVNTENVVEQPVTGSITIIKDAVPGSAQDFAFTTTGSGLSGFSLDDDADATLSNQRTISGLAAGPYTVAETATTGWTLTSITCSTGGSGDTVTRTASIALVAGANVTCTFVNTQVVTTGGGIQPGTTPRGGTLGGNPLPNTAMLSEITGSAPATLLALLMLVGLGAGGWITVAEARRRR